MDRQIPLAAAPAALLVSSDRWAEASYPVIVYWVRMAEMGSTKSSQPAPLVAPLNMPVLLIVLAKTSCRLAWWAGTRTRMRMTAAAPATCHQTETLLSTASRWLEKMLMTEAMTRMITNMMNTLVRL